VVAVVKEFFTITELAEKTSIPDTTVRRYIQKFSDFFMYKGGSRSRRYEESAIKILIRVKNLFDNGYETEQVDAILRKEFSMIIDGDKQEENDKTPALATAEDVAEIKESLKEQKEFNKLLLERLEQQDRYIKESLESRDRTLMESLRTIQEEKQARIETAASMEKEEKKKGFLSRLFGG
jgi:DNA-binding transcriptional MerR regulator